MQVPIYAEIRIINIYVACLLNPDKDCGPADVDVTATPSSPISRGATLTLQCSAMDPTRSGLTYQWLKDGQLVPLESSDRLVRSAVVKEDAGVYTCRVSNRVGEGEANVTVTISEDWPQAGTHIVTHAYWALTLCKVMHRMSYKWNPVMKFYYVFAYGVLYLLYNYSV